MLTRIATVAFALSLAVLAQGKQGGIRGEPAASTDTPPALAMTVASPQVACGPDTCGGCCDGDVCRLGVSNGFCGIGGEDCFSCVPQDHEKCVQHACVRAP